MEFQSPSRRGVNYFTTLVDSGTYDCTFQSPSRRGVNYFASLPCAPYKSDTVSVPFAKGRQLLLNDPNGPTVTYVSFQSPSRRGVNYFIRRLIQAALDYEVSVPFAKGRQLLRPAHQRTLGSHSGFSPLREGASITSLPDVGAVSYSIICFSPLREGASITSRI